MQNHRRAIFGAEPLANTQASILVSEFPLNPHESFRAEIITTNGRTVVRLSRRKTTANGPSRTGQVFEFGAHRTAGVAKIIRDIQQVLALGDGRVA